MSETEIKPETTPEEISEVPEQTKEQLLEEEVAKLKDQLLRTAAELENNRKRFDREKEDLVKYALTGFARDLLNVSDNLRRALETIQKETLEPTIKTMVEGVEMTEKEILTVFQKYGIQKVEPVGQAFDHNVHQAMFEIETDEHPQGTVVQMLQPGYTLHGRLLRPALVGVAKPKQS
ncbi:Nucleotide exchange factor GrpE [Candidatus Bealeia paramacronuclearis]|uniref:Protein GrpE n=1 Tax=Candidatus Bealeia paramacronuclearis TaxID=1921001 RepID=A0ABZ2C3A3_9PROT|nr:Nucleotide exchange factor GrpE [Candidatus Bealeia paramacronuclearis]